jgi:hypothetical protein
MSRLGVFEQCGVALPQAKCISHSSAPTVVRRSSEAASHKNTCPIPLSMYALAGSSRIQCGRPVSTIVNSGTNAKTEAGGTCGGMQNSMHGRLVSKYVPEDFGIDCNLSTDKCDRRKLCRQRCFQNNGRAKVKWREGHSCLAKYQKLANARSSTASVGLDSHMTSVLCAARRLQRLVMPPLAQCLAAVVAHGTGASP